MSILNPEQIHNAGNFIFKNGRLLERKLFEYFFKNGTKSACLKALIAYQNEDGGFGNGIEPDLLCPDSSAIGAETALYVLDLLDCHDHETVSSLVNWIVTHQKAAGFIDHPPENIFNYPYQAWWKNPDRERILALAGILKKYRDHYPLFSRGWFYASDDVEREVLADEAAVFVNAIHADGEINSPYLDFPWWRPILLLD
jgi:hypothetical protein